ncbi:unnamed protein product [Clonostachys rosea]|uniref:Uncharacterized protein n=1 Tax=Bionectria ochroleuca TaxID=29856 RepID=A0ABY6U8P8_BIOOC|nr:unnamed protein product [Clonostachys rosea]
MKPKNFIPERDVPDLSSKVILVTGGNTGLGKQHILELCRHNPGEVWLAARNLEKAKDAVARIQKAVPNAPVKVLELDLSSFSSVKAAAATFIAQCNRLDILVLNAGLMSVPPSTTNDGFEMQFATNFLGHALLTTLLIPTMEQTVAIQGDSSDVRVVGVTSYGYTFAPKKGIEFDLLKTPCERLSDMQRYGQSKLAMIMWLRQLAKHHPEIKTASVHPGLVASDFGTSRDKQYTGIMKFVRGLYTKVVPSVEEGVKNQLWASVAPDVQSGEYYEPVGVSGKLSKMGRNDDLAGKLWIWTEKEIAESAH